MADTDMVQLMAVYTVPSFDSKIETSKPELLLLYLCRCVFSAFLAPSLSPPPSLLFFSNNRPLQRIRFTAMIR